MYVIELIWDIVLDCLKDLCFILPVLYLTYLLMELIEHFAGDRTLNLIKKSKKAGPLFGAILGAIPECGISGGIANLYAAGIISVGAFVAAVLSTSDEMLAVLLGNGKVKTLVSFLVFKVLFGVVAGFAVDLVFSLVNRLRKKHGKEPAREGTICEICERENCLCGHHHHEGEEHEEEHEGEEHGHHGLGEIFLAALIHTLKIGGIILAVSFVIGLGVELLGNERIASLPLNMPVLGELITAVFGLIPNCSVSVILSNLYVEGIIGGGPLMAGLLANGGVGLLVFFRMNRGKGKWKQNLGVTAIILVLSFAGGLLASLF